MGFHSARPSKILSRYIQQYWGLEHCYHNGQIYHQRIVPNGLTELTFYFNNVPVSNDPSKQIGGQTIVSGQLNEYYDLHVSGKTDLFSVSFKPAGVLLLLNLPLNNLTNKNIALQDIMKHDTVFLEDQLYNQSFEGRVAIIERYLIDKLQKHTSFYQYNRIVGSIEKFDNEEETTNVSQMANKACYSPRHFDRAFQHQIGLKPKQFIRVVRFQRAIYHKSVHPSISLTELAMASGYYDQSHMIQDFKKFSGMTPKQYFDICPPVSDYFA